MAHTMPIAGTIQRSGGEHFNVPGGTSVAQYEAQLKEVFREIAADRPLMLIQEP